MTDHRPIDESRLIDLVAGLLAKEESDETRAHLRSCSECEQRFQTLAGRYESRVAGPLPTRRDGRFRLAPKRPLMTKRVWVTAVAASVVVAFAGAFLVAKRERPLEYWIPIGQEAVVLRSATEPSPHSTAGDVLEPYSARDATAAVEELKRLQVAPEDVTAAALRTLFLASALVNAGREEDALEELENIVVRWLPTQWRGEAEWVQYVALVRLHRDAESLAHLERLSQEPDEIGARARAELKRRRE